jgi:hypothetical protein
MGLLGGGALARPDQARERPRTGEEEAQPLLKASTAFQRLLEQAREIGHLEGRVRSRLKALGHA